jgi:hypothetical protein
MSTLPAGPYLPNSSLVVSAWLGQRVPGIVPAQVATRLPRNLSTWADEGFVQVTIVPTPAEVDIPLRHAYAQIDAWAVRLNADGSAGAKPPVNLAWRLANLIARACEDDVQRVGGFGREVALPADYLAARVQAAYFQTEPSEVPDDPSGYARVTFDLALDWARL